MSRSASVAVPRRQLYAVPERRASLELEDSIIVSSSLKSSSSGPREYDSWPCDSFLLLPDSVLAMDAGAFRDDLRSLDPVLSASLPDWPQSNMPIFPSSKGFVGIQGGNSSSSSRARTHYKDGYKRDKRSFTLMDHHEGLLVHSAGKGTILIGGGGDGRGNATSSSGGNSGPENRDVTLNPAAPTNPEGTHNPLTSARTSSDPSQKDLSSGLCYKDREERVRQMRERRQIDRQQKLEELKEQAAVAIKFREQQDSLRKQRVEDMRSREMERRSQVEERRKIIEQAEQDRREAVLRRSAERDQRYELKRRQERSSNVFAFGSSTPRMLDPKENIPGYWASRRATSTTNVNLVDSTAAGRRSSECIESDLSRKRATSAHSLNRKPEDDLMSRSFTSSTPSAARRRTDLIPSIPPTRESPSSKTSPRHRSPGVRSGAATPSSPSRPTSALSQGSGGSQVVLRQRASPRKPRPLSIAGTTPSSADKPREIMSSSSSSSSAAAVASPNRESRPIERKSSLSTGVSKTVSRAKSIGSDSSTPSTPQKTPSKPVPPKRTPAQVKAESAAKKAAEKNKISSKTRATPKSTPLQSPSTENKALPSVGKKAAVPTKPKESPPPPPPELPAEIKDDPPSTLESKSILEDSKAISTSESQPVIQVDSQPQVLTTKIEQPKTDDSKPPVVDSEPAEQAEIQTEEVKPPTEQAEIQTEEVKPPTEQAEIQTKEVKPPTETPKLTPAEETAVEQMSTPTAENVEKSESETEAKTPAQKAAEKPVTGYQSEEEYKAVLAEKRRQAREAKEREIELERQRQLEEEERERREEQEYLRLIEEQKKAEEERLQKAIVEAERLRQEEVKKKEVEEIQRLENERIEQQKQLEAEEKLRKEEEDRQVRKSRVAAIMARTRGKGGPTTSTPSKAEVKTPSEENKNMNDSVMMTESFISAMSSSMTDSMIVQAIESHQAQNEEQSPEEQPSHTDSPLFDSSNPVPQPASIPDPSSSGRPSTTIEPSILDPPSISENLNATSQISSFKSTKVTFSDQSSQPSSDISSQPLSDVSSAAPSTIEISSQSSEEITVISGHQSLEIMSGQASLTATTTEHSSEHFTEAHVNGDRVTSTITTPTVQPLDLIDSYSGVNGINHNGVAEPHRNNHISTAAAFDPFDPLIPLSEPQKTFSSSDAKSEPTFEQIIDLNQTKLANEDAVNCNNPPPPIIAFEENKNNKQTQDRTNNVPDLLL